MPCSPPRRLRAVEERHGRQPPAVHRHGIALLVLDLDVDGHVGRGLRRVRQEVHLRRRLRPRVLEDAALERDVEEIAVGGVRPVRRHGHGDVVAPRELDQGRPRIEVPLAPRGDHREIGRERRVRELEAHLVIALAGRAVAHRVRPFPPRHVDLRLGDERPRDRRAHQVGALVQRIGAQHGEDEVPDELVPEIGDVHAPPPPCGGPSRESGSAPRPARGRRRRPRPRSGTSR